MNLDILISNELRNVVSRSYESELYKTAILDSIHFLSDIIREKAEVDGDGIALVTQAFGGESPKLRINKLQTQSEKDEQKGFEHLIRGLYLGIRNPRSHEQIEDKKSTADSLIMFIDFLLESIGKAKQAFTLETWQEKVFDPDFVKDQEYVDLIVAQVPAKKRFDALVNVYRRKDEGDISNVSLVIRNLLKSLNEHQTNEFISEVSNELQNARDRDVYDFSEDSRGYPRHIMGEDTILQILQVFPEEYWVKLDRIAKKRIENKLIQSIASGEYDTKTQNCLSGGFGTWAREFIKYFESENKDKLYQIFMRKITEGKLSQNYVMDYFPNQLKDTLVESDSRSQLRAYFNAFVMALSTGVENRLLVGKIIQKIPFSSEWKSELRKKLANPNHEVDRKVFGLPELEDEDIPF